MSEDERVDLVSFTGSTPVKFQNTFLFNSCVNITEAFEIDSWLEKILNIKL